MSHCSSVDLVSVNKSTGEEVECLVCNRELFCVFKSNKTNTHLNEFLIGDFTQILFRKLSENTNIELIRLLELEHGKSINDLEQGLSAETVSINHSLSFLQQIQRRVRKKAKVLNTV